MTAPNDDDLFKKMFASFVNRKTRGSGSRSPPNHPLPPPPPELRRVNTGLGSRVPYQSSHLRPLKSSYHPPPPPAPSNKHLRHFEPHSGGLGGLLSLRQPGDNSRSRNDYRASGKRSVKSSKGSKGSRGGSKGSEKVPSASTEDAPPRKRTRVLNRHGTNVDGVLLRTHSAHASLHSTGSGKLSKSRSSTRIHVPSTAPPSGSSSRGGPSAKPPSQKRFPCEQCEAVFAQNGQLSRHVRRVHDKLRPFACEHCGRLFGARSDRSRHVTIVHKKVRQFPCVRCGFEFQAKTHLEAHIRTVHEGERPYSCDQCGFSFGLRSNLLTHQRAVHEKEAKWICPVCQTAFNRKHDMHRHQKLMHEDHGASASSSKRR